MSGVFALLILAAATLAAAAVSASPPPLPMTARYIPTQQGVPHAIHFSGLLPTRAAGERVTIFGRGCLTRYDRQLEATQSFAGGGWEVTLGGSTGRPEDISTGVTYRARWRGRWSVPFTFRVRKTPQVAKVAEGRFEVTVHNATPIQSFDRKPVVLQRATGSGFVDVRTQRLRVVDARTFTTTFVVRQSGLTLRVLVPTKTARPCYDAGASEIFRS